MSDNGSGLQDVSDLSAVKVADIKAEQVGVNGVVFDVSCRQEMFGEGKPFALFAGRDASVLMARNSLVAEDLEEPLTEVNEKQKESLEKWERFFHSTYAPVARLEDGFDLSKTTLTTSKPSDESADSAENEE